MPTQGRGLRCRLVTLEAVYELSHALACEVRRAGFDPELIVAIARGGFVPARLLCDFLGVHALVSLRIRHYGPGAREEGPARADPGFAGDASQAVRGRRVLVVDDVNDTGETLALARTQLAALGPRELRVAVLHEKSSSSESADFRAELLEQWRWLLYQWAVVEDTLAFVSGMEPRVATSAEARERLDAELGLVFPDSLWEKLSGRLP